MNIASPPLIRRAPGAAPVAASGACHRRPGVHRRTRNGADRPSPLEPRRRTSPRAASPRDAVPGETDQLVDQMTAEHRTGQHGTTLDKDLVDLPRRELQQQALSGSMRPPSWGRRCTSVPATRSSTSALPLTHAPHTPPASHRRGAACAHAAAFSDVCPARRATAGGVALVVPIQSTFSEGSSVSTVLIPVTTGNCARAAAAPARAASPVIHLLSPLSIACGRRGSWQLCIARTATR